MKKIMMRFQYCLFLLICFAMDSSAEVELDYENKVATSRTKEPITTEYWKKLASQPGHWDYWLITSSRVTGVPVQNECMEIATIVPGNVHFFRAGIINNCATIFREYDQCMAPTNSTQAKIFMLYRTPVNKHLHAFFEYNDHYYFSSRDKKGENSNYDFSQGYYIRKGSATIYEWKAGDLYLYLESKFSSTNPSVISDSLDNKPEPLLFVVKPNERDLFNIRKAKQCMKMLKAVNAPPAETAVEALSLIQSSVEISVLPKYYCELEGVYYFSVELEHESLYPFTDGFAVIKGESDIYQWSIVDIVDTIKSELTSEQKKRIGLPVGAETNAQGTQEQP